MTKESPHVDAQNAAGDDGSTASNNAQGCVAALVVLVQLVASGIAYLMAVSSVMMTDSCHEGDTSRICSGRLDTAIPAYLIFIAVLDIAAFIVLFRRPMSAARSVAVGVGGIMGLLLGWLAFAGYVGL